MRKAFFLTDLGVRPIFRRAIIENLLIILNETNMKTKIEFIHLAHLRNEDHYQFMLRYQDLLGTYPSTVTIISSLMTEFTALFAKERQMVDAIKASEYTEEIAAADKRRDQAIVGFHAIVKALLRHSDPKTVAAAKSIDFRIRSFREEIARKSYDSESTAVEIFVDDMEMAYADKVTKLGLTNWIEDLATAHNDFQTLFARRAAESTARPEGQLKEVRRQLDAVYNAMTKMIEAYVMVNGEKGYDEFIKELNYRIAYVNEHDLHQTKTDIKKVDIVTIPDQIYEGKPVVVLPEVYYEDKELTFAADYDVTYKDNNKPGLATLIVHGKNAYKGKKILTFRIVKPLEEE
jgi:hypothetical protein